MRYLTGLKDHKQRISVIEKNIYIDFTVIPDSTSEKIRSAPPKSDVSLWLRGYRSVQKCFISEEILGQRKGQTEPNMFGRETHVIVPDAL